MIDQTAEQNRFANPLFNGLCSSLTGAVIGTMFTNVNPLTAGVFTTVSVLMYGPTKSVTQKIFADDLDHELEKLTVVAIQAIASTSAAILATNLMGFPITKSSAIWLGVLYSVSQVALRCMGCCCNGVGEEL